MPGRNASRAASADNTGNSRHQSDEQNVGTPATAGIQCNARPHSNEVPSQASLLNKVPLDNKVQDNILSVVLPHLTAVLDSKLREMEDRICTRIVNEISRSEQRLARLIQDRTGSPDHLAVQVSEVDEAELDLD